MTTTTDLLDLLERPHLHGHSCPTLGSSAHGTWHNPNAGSAGPCPTLTALRDVRAELEAADAAVLVEHARVHAAAHDDELALITGMAAAGYGECDHHDVHDDDRAGFRQMGRMAIEALAEQLDQPE